MSNNIKNKENKKKSVKKTEKKSQVVLYRLLMVLALDILAIAFFISIKKEASRESFFVFDVLPVLTIVFAALSVVSIGYYAFTKAKHVDISKYICTPAMISGIMLVSLAICLLYKSVSLQKIVVSLIIVNILYFIYYLYKRSFFIYSLLTAFSYLIIVTLGSVTYFSDKGGFYTALKVTAIVIALAAGAFVLAAKGKGGKISVGKREISLCEDKFDLIAFAATIGLLVISVVISFFAAGFTSYMSIVLLMSFLVIAIIYTIKMI